VKQAKNNFHPHFYKYTRIHVMYMYKMYFCVNLTNMKENPISACDM